MILQIHGVKIPKQADMQKFESDQERLKYQKLHQNEYTQEYAIKLQKQLNEELESAIKKEDDERNQNLLNQNKVNIKRQDSCSWFYHNRCLKGINECFDCFHYDTSKHTCSNCSYFNSSPGQSKKGDSWYGICTAYDGNPIRHSPSSHTCKAWS